MSTKLSFSIPSFTDLRQDFARWKVVTYHDLLRWYIPREEQLFTHAPLWVWNLCFTLFHRCGGLYVTHHPVLGHPCRWMWKITKEERMGGLARRVTRTCQVCGKEDTGIDYGTNLEIVPDQLKEDRVKHAKDMLQRWSPDNTLSKEFVETYPEQVKGMIDKGVVTKEQVRTSKYTYKKDMKGLDQLPHEGAAAVLGKE